MGGARGGAEAAAEAVRGRASPQPPGTAQRSRAGRSPGNPVVLTDGSPDGGEHEAIAQPPPPGQAASRIVLHSERTQPPPSAIERRSHDAIPCHRYVRDGLRPRVPANRRRCRCSSHASALWPAGPSRLRGRTSGFPLQIERLRRRPGLRRPRHPGVSDTSDRLTHYSLHRSSAEVEVRSLHHPARNTSDVPVWSNLT